MALNQKIFLMTVDVDDWASLLRFYSVKCDMSEAENLVETEKGLDILVNLFKKHNIKATFFVPAKVVEKYSKKIKSLISEGHEIACHGYFHHKDECLLDKINQKILIRKALNIFDSIIECRPLGFRAPCLRANKRTLEVLNEMEFIYDSSFLPMFIPKLYGSFSKFKLKPYYPLFEGNLLEIPVSANPALLLPLSAAWMRNLGLSWIKSGVKTLFNMGCPVMFYIHPRDIMTLPKMPKVPMYVYRNTGKKALLILDGLLNYVKQLNAKIMRTIDFAFTLKSFREYT